MNFLRRIKAEAMFSVGLLDPTCLPSSVLSAFNCLDAPKTMYLEPFAPHLADIKVGFVAEHGRHPDADKLSVCKVELGEVEPLQIVCGAPNVAAGQKVAVATVGTVLPGDYKI